VRESWLVGTRAELTDGQWAVIEPLMPRVTGRSRPHRDHRQVVEGIVRRHRCGVAWRDLPDRSGPWQTAWKRHARFSRDGTWDKVPAAEIAHADAAGEVDWAVWVEPADHGIGRSRGGLSTEVHHAVDGRGRPLSVLIGAGQAGDAPACLQGHPGPPALPRDHRGHSRAPRQQGHRARRGTEGGRPVGYDRELDKQRNVVEGSYALLQQWRGLATRYDEHALVHRGAVVLAALQPGPGRARSALSSHATMPLWTHSRRLPTSVAVWLP
jgi:transposase